MRMWCLRQQSSGPHDAHFFQSSGPIFSPDAAHLLERFFCRLRGNRRLWPLDQIFNAGYGGQTDLPHESNNLQLSTAPTGTLTRRCSCRFQTTGTCPQKLRRASSFRGPDRRVVRRFNYGIMWAPKSSNRLLFRPPSCIKSGGSRQGLMAA
jgi:hypothetical protein